MSKVALSGNASGTGTFTIASPNSNTDRTLTLPDNTGTVVTTGSTAVVSQAMLEAGVVPLGVGQSWQSVIGSRSSGVTYTNSTGKPIAVAIHTTEGGTGILTVGGVSINRASNNFWYTAVVPNETGYSFNGGYTVWVELR